MTTAAHHALRAVARGATLTREEARAAVSALLDEDDLRRRSRAASSRRWPPGAKRSRPWRAPWTSSGRAPRGLPWIEALAARSDRRLRNRGRRARHVQRLDRGGLRRRGRGHAGREAREPRRLVGLRLRRRPRRARRRDRDVSRPRRRGAPARERHVLLRAALSPRDEEGRPAAARAGRAHGVQSRGAALESRSASRGRSSAWITPSGCP